MSTLWRKLREAIEADESEGGEQQTPPALDAAPAEDADEHPMIASQRRLEARIDAAIARGELRG